MYNDDLKKLDEDFEKQFDEEFFHTFNKNLKSSQDFSVIEWIALITSILIGVIGAGFSVWVIIKLLQHFGVI